MHSIIILVSELRSCVKVVVAVLGLISLTVSVDIKYSERRCFVF